MRGNESLNVDGYKFYGNNRKQIHKRATRGSAGVGAFVKNEVSNSFEISILDDNVEGILWLEFNSKITNSRFCVAICYLPPAESCRPVDADTFFHDLLQQVYIYQHKGKIIICGDFNARIGPNLDYIEGVDLVKPRNVLDTVENHHGDVFSNFLSDINFGMLNGRFEDNEYTYISTTGKSVVDYICVPYEEMEYISDFKIITMSDIVNNVSFMPDSIPDHSLLYCDFKVDFNNKVHLNPPKNTDRIRYKVSSIPDDFLLNEEIYAKVLETIYKIENYIEATSDIQNAYDEFQDLLKCEMDMKLPKYKDSYSRAKSTKFRYKPYWNDDLAIQWNKVNALEKKWLRFDGPNSAKRKIKEEYCSERKYFDRLNRKFKRKYQSQERKRIEDKLYDSNQREFWKSIGKTGIANERKPCIPMAVVDPDGSVNTHKDDVLNKWKSDFQTLFQRNGGQDNKRDPSIFNTEIDVSSLNEPISRKEVADAVMQAKLRKASGIDEIPTEVLKNDTAIDLLFQIISGCFRLGKVPIQWNTGVINPILKPGTDDDRNPLNYRGITLISVPCKIYCTILNSRLSKWLENNDMLCDEQNGFRRDRSCEEHIHSLYSILNDRK